MVEFYTGLLLSSLLVVQSAYEFTSLETMADAIGKGQVQLVFQSPGTSLYRDIFTHQSDAMYRLRQAIAHNPVAFANSTEQLLAVSNGWGE